MKEDVRRHKQKGEWEEGSRIQSSCIIWYQNDMYLKNCNQSKADLWTKIFWCSSLPEKLTQVKRYHVTDTNPPENHKSLQDLPSSRKSLK